MHKMYMQRNTVRASTEGHYIDCRRDTQTQKNALNQEEKDAIALADTLHLMVSVCNTPYSCMQWKTIQKQDDDWIALAIRYIDAECLYWDVTGRTKLIVSQQKTDTRHLEYLAFQVIRGLTFIHKAGVIHR
eukprot:476166_1